MNSLEKVLLKYEFRDLANYLVYEHPQTIALALLHIEHEKRGQILKRLPEGIQADVCLRIANLDSVEDWIIERLASTISRELGAITKPCCKVGGVKEVSDVLNILDKNTESSIMSRLEEKDPMLAEEVRKLMFIFEDIVKIDDKGIQCVLKEVPNDKLLLSLKTASDEVKEKFFKNITQRASDMLREDLANMVPCRLADVESAQQEIVRAIRRLEAEGKILIARGGSEDALV